MLSAFAGGRLFGEATGAAPRHVLALHGWGRDHSDFREMTGGDPAVGAVALDLPGFGASPAPSEAWGSAEYSAAVAPVLDELSAPVVIVGHSFGGRVALHLAATNAERVDGVLLSGVPQLLARQAPAVPFAYRLARRLNRLGVISDARMEDRRRRSGSVDYRAASGVHREIFVRLMSEDYEAQLAALDCPVALVWGELDTAAPVEVAERAAALVRNGRAKLEVLAGVGHLTPIEAPTALRRSLERLLADVGA